MTYNDPNHRNNSTEHHTGKLCIELECDEPAGTAWSPYWCFEHNVKRMDRISAQFDGMLQNFPGQHPRDSSP